MWGIYIIANNVTPSFKDRCSPVPASTTSRTDKCKSGEDLVILMVVFSLVKVKFSLLPK